MVVLVFPHPERGGQLLEGADAGPPLELLLAGLVAALGFPVAVGAARRDVPVGDAEGVQVPRDIGPELGAVVGLDPLDGQ